jgi:ubiquinone/menaquinone biosynthesis C-methylase UbiE
MKPYRVLSLWLPILILAVSAGVDRGRCDETAPQDPAGEPIPEHDFRGDHDATSRHHFQDLEHWLQVFEDPERDKWQQPDRVVRELGIGNGDVVADVGAGTGYFSLHLASAVAPAGHVFAVDIEPGMVGYIAERSERETIGNLTPVLALPHDPMLPPGGVDLVFICDTFHHFDDRVGYLKRLKQDLSPGGRIAVIDFLKKELPIGPPPAHKLPRDHVVAEFLEAGYTLVEEKAFLPYQYFLIFRPADSD